MRPVSAEFKPSTPPSRLLWVVAGICGGLATASVAMALHQKHALTAAQAKLQRATTVQQADFQIAAVEPAPVRYERSAREMIQERALPWPAALTALEATPLAGVALRSVEAQSGDGAVRIELTVADHARVLDYIEALNAGSGHAPDSFKWALQQTQSESTSGVVVAMVIGRKGGRTPSR